MKKQQTEKVKSGQGWLDELSTGMRSLFQKSKAAKTTSAVIPKQLSEQEMKQQAELLGVKIFENLSSFKIDRELSKKNPLLIC